MSSGCLCWDQPKDHPQTFGWQPDYTVEGKILGQWIAHAQQCFSGLGCGLEGESLFEQPLGELGRQRDAIAAFGLLAHEQPCRIE